MRKLSSEKIFDIANVFILILLSLVILYPLYFTVIASFSEPTEVVTGKVYLWPKGFTLESYKNIFKNSDIWRGYVNSILYTALGTVLGLVLTIPAAYALSKKDMRYRGIFSMYFVITMFFGGGLLPTYLLVKDIGLINKPYTLIILGSFSVYNMVVVRTYFQNSIPGSLYEAARIDGCSDYGQFFRIAIPLAKPIIAVIALYYAVVRWNDYFSALIYLNDSEYYPLQMVLRNILLENQTALSNITSMAGMKSEQLTYLARQQYMAEAMKYGIILIGSLPMLIVYPFIQKYFVKGVMVGSVKG